LKPADSFVDVGQRAQDQDRRPAAGLAQRSDDAEAVDTSRKHAVHDDRVVGLARGEKHPVSSVVGVIDRVASFGQPFSDEARYALVVLDEQDLHAVRALMNSIRGNPVGKAVNTVDPTSSARPSSSSHEGAQADYPAPA